MLSLGPRPALIANGQRGSADPYECQGELRSLAYGRPISIHIDPIEKKPLYHYSRG